MTDKKCTPSKQILIIDDDITALDIVSFLVQERGYLVERCTDGNSAITCAQDMMPDLIIVDLMMPDINGIETVKQIRSLGMTQVPIIAFTAVDDPDLHREACDAGCDEVITKPCRPDKLIKQIENKLMVK